VKAEKWIALSWFTFAWLLFCGPLLLLAGAAYELPFITGMPVFEIVVVTTSTIWIVLTFLIIRKKTA
jgi:hypothetical protein